MKDNLQTELKKCFELAEREEKKGRKHKGLLAVKPDKETAKEYIQKARDNLELCDIYREKGFDYKIPEEWFYTLYYCALAVLSKFGVESRSQKWTALFLQCARENNLINYDEEFIKRITVHKEKEETSDVDEREKSRYGPFIKIDAVKEKYEYMNELCKMAISQAEEIIYSDKKLEIPKELLN
jgi:hypothetical protein